MIQSELHWENADANLKLFDEKINLFEHADIIILPEMFSTGFSMRPELFAERMDGTVVQQMKRWAADKNAAICGSLMMNTGDKYFNRFMWVEPSGNIYTYDKRHLFGLGDEQKHYIAGHQILTIEWRGFRIRCAICYDLRFPVWLRNTDNYDILILVANWPQRRIYAWKQLLIARAIENQCYVAAVNRVGNDGNGIYHNGCSMFIGPKGEIIDEQIDEEAILQQTIHKSELDQVRRELPFLNDADTFTLIP
jgi:predicted amidohydrolase